MHRKTDGLASNEAQQSTGIKTLAYLDAAQRLLSTWIWTSDPSARKGKRLALNWGRDVDEDRRVIEKLTRMSDHELFDIGLARSDLTLEGLATAASKRALQQDVVAAEIATSPTQREADKHGDQY